MEENGGGDGNSSVAQLEVRIETLEGTAADHETRISSTESDVAGRQFISGARCHVDIVSKLNIIASYKCWFYME